MPRSVRPSCAPSASRLPHRAVRSWRRVPCLGLCALAVTGCYQDPQAQLDEAQAQLDLTATLEELGSRSADLQFQLDSLRGVVARQDTTIARLANLAGVPYPR
ncbi:MAG: hypothetical protein ACO3F5_08920 [Gemmatimonadaceae bacterium]